MATGMRAANAYASNVRPSIRQPFRGMKAATSVMSRPASVRMLGCLSVESIRNDPMKKTTVDTTAVTTALPIFEGPAPDLISFHAKYGPNTSGSQVMPMTTLSLPTRALTTHGDPQC